MLYIWLNFEKKKRRLAISCAAAVTAQLICAFLFAYVHVVGFPMLIFQMKVSHSSYLLYAQGKKA